MRDYDDHFREYVHLHHFPRAAEALHILRRIGSCVKPIMRKRGWRVGQLCEFYPPQPNLLGLNTNRGEMIHLRLRYPSDDNQFLAFEAVLDTMLHELSHIHIGPHNNEFQNLWDSLREEWEQLALKGYTGEGFLGKGQQVGGLCVPTTELRRRARARVFEREKERKRKEKAHGGRRLGGLLPSRNTNPVAEAAIKRATENMEKGCGTGTKAGQRAAEDAALNGFKTKAAMDEANEAAINQALIELLEEEERKDIQHALARGETVNPPPSEGLVWDAQNGLQPAPLANLAPNLQRPLYPCSATLPKPQTKASNGVYPHRPYGDGFSKAQPPWSIFQPLQPAVDLSAQPQPDSDPREMPRSSPRYVTGTQSHSIDLTHTPTRSNRPLSHSVHEDDGMHRLKRHSQGHSRPSSLLEPAAMRPARKPWDCPECTLINEPDATICEACTRARDHWDMVGATAGPPSTWMPEQGMPVDVGMGLGAEEPLMPPTTRRGETKSGRSESGWKCKRCGSFMEQKYWACSSCGLMKDRS